MRKNEASHVVLTSHPIKVFKETPLIDWGNKDPLKRGPVIGTLTNLMHKNAIGTHSGNYTIYHALATACGDLKKDHKPDLTNTAPIIDIGPFPSWYDQDRIISLDPWGAKVGALYKNYFKKGYDIRPTIAITAAYLKMPEIEKDIDQGNIKIDGKIVTSLKNVFVHKAAIESVWYLPGLANRFNLTEGELRKTLFQDTGGMYPELVTRPDLKVFLPPIGSTSVYIFGDVNKIPSQKDELTVRVHDECNGSDVFGSDICTCRPYLVHGIQECIKTAQKGGTGVIVYFRKEGRALGEVTKFLVYNARKRHKEGDSAHNYFKMTECIAGVEDMRFQELMPDVLHWLGVKQISRLVSMSDLKYNAIISSGIKVKKRVTIPKDLIPDDAFVEIEAKKAAGYYAGIKKKDTKKTKKRSNDLKKVKGRKLERS